MYICSNCYKLFDTPRELHTTYEGEPLYKRTIEVCPYCEDETFAEAPECSVCGDPIDTEEFIKTDDGNFICSDCYSKYDIDDLFDKPEWFR